MLFLNKVALMDEPKQELYAMLRDRGWEEPLMREDETSFLCGLLREESPRNILEVGVYSGCTTAIMAQCMCDMGVEACEIHSIDLAEYCDTDKAKPVGNIYEKLRDHYAKRSIVQTFYTGDVAPAQLDKIGKTFDFLMLDTAHILQGELLDFLSILPFMKDGAMVCLHDTSLHQMHPSREKEMACGLLLSCLAADKYINARDVSSDDEFWYPNIAAFRISKQTRDQIDNVFLGLCLKWQYFPTYSQLCSFRRCLREHYPADLCDIFEEAVRMNCDSRFTIDLEGIPFGSLVILYGASALAETFWRKVNRMGYCRILHWVDPDYQKWNDPRITNPDRISYDEADLVVIGASEYKVYQKVYEKLVREKKVDFQKIYTSYVPFDDLKE